MILFIIAIAILLLAAINVFSMPTNLAKAFAIAALVSGLLLLLQFFHVITLSGRM